MFVKCVLCPPQRNKKKQVVMESLLSSQLHSWEHGELVSLWIEARFEADQNLVKTSHISLDRSNNLRALKLAKNSFTKNAFNECDRETFCRHLHQDFPELFSWVGWCIAQLVNSTLLTTYYFNGWCPTKRSSWATSFQFGHFGNT